MNNLQAFGYDYNIILNILLLTVALISVRLMFKSDSNLRIGLFLVFLIFLGFLRLYLRSHCEVVLIAKGSSSYVEYDSLYKKLYFYVKAKGSYKLVSSIDYGLKECENNSQCILKLQKQNVDFYKNIYKLNEKSKSKYKITDQEFLSYVVNPL